MVVKNHPRASGTRAIMVTKIARDDAKADARTPRQDNTQSASVHASIIEEGESDETKVKAHRELQLEDMHEERNRSSENQLSTPEIDSLEYTINTSNIQEADDAKVKAVVEQFQDTDDKNNTANTCATVKGGDAKVEGIMEQFEDTDERDAATSATRQRNYTELTEHPRYFSSISSSAEETVSMENISARALVGSARHTLYSSRRTGMKLLKTNLKKRMHLLDTKLLQQVHAGGFEDVLIESWIEELLRFLALKTILKDRTKPFELAPGGPICVAWKELMLSPTDYSSVCFAMGNTSVIDHDPFDTNLSPEELRHLERRLNAAKRHYVHHFEDQPPVLFWRDVEIPREPFILVQVYRMTQQMWTDFAQCSNTTTETISKKWNDSAKMKETLKKNDILTENYWDEDVQRDSAAGLFRPAFIPAE